MKLLILGTSNGILQGGYAAGLSAALPDAEIDNKSVGASPGTQFAAFCTPHLAAYDCVIFDSVINDENQAANIGSPAFFQSLLRDIFTYIAQHSNLVVLGYCNQRHLTEPSSVYAVHREAAEAAGGVFFGFRDFFLGRADGWAGYEPVYEDEPHPNRRISYEFGQAVGTQIRHYSKKSVVSGVVQHFHKLDVHNAGTPYTKSNRLMTQSFHALRAGDVFEFPLQELIGFSIDSFNSNGFLQFEGPDGVYNMRLFFTPNQKRFAVKFIPIRNGFRAFRLRCLEHVEVFEKAPHSNEDGCGVTLVALASLVGRDVPL